MLVFLRFRLLLIQDEQPELQGPGVWVSTERGATESPIGMHFLELCIDMEHLDFVWLWFWSLQEHFLCNETLSILQTWKIVSGTFYWNGTEDYGDVLSMITTKEKVRVLLEHYSVLKLCLQIRVDFLCSVLNVLVV